MSSASAVVTSASRKEFPQAAQIKRVGEHAPRKAKVRRPSALTKPPFRICSIGHRKKTAKNAAVATSTMRANGFDIARECGGA